MATRVVMPKLSDTMTEGTINEWLKKEGDRVEAGEALATVETDKATMELEAYSSGVLQKIAVPAGGSAPVGHLIAVIAEADEDIRSLLAEAGAPAARGKAEPEGAAAEPAAAEPIAAAPGAPGNGRPAEVPQPRPAPVPVGAGRVRASPLARRLAEERGLDLAQIPGTGPAGRVIRRDVEQYEVRPARPAAAPERVPVPPAERPAAPPPVPGALEQPRAAWGGLPRPAAPVVGPTPFEDRPLTSMRRTIAQRMVEAKTTVPHYYLTAEIDMDRAVEMRAALLAVAPDVKVTYTDMILKACGLALARHPQVNASFLGDRVRYWKRADIGLAVALEEGLITPIVAGCDVKSLGQIALEAKALAERARAKKLRPEEYQGGSFSVSNLGMFDVEEFAAIVNPPHGAILAVGAVVRKPIVKGDGTLGVGHRMRATLSCDHRVVDGAVGAAFLRDVKRLLEQPAALAL